ncbi:DUF58 domain-containing protein [Thiohalocapsa halophila]|uniref:DUF58 domain-containing protein n=1 Tax=Thiohalocapsa halophila TaxID=69359 RepID=UPI001F5B11AA|nr:DUF58 domain-containing protein [Thiohalocapsa halophila]
MTGLSPNRGLLIAAAAWTSIALAAAWLPVLVPLWQGAGALLAALAGADLWLLLRTPLPQVTRQVAGILPQGVWCDVQLALVNAASRTLRLDLHDLHPADAEPQGLPASAELGPGARATLSYRLKAPSRGVRAFGGCDLRLHSPLGLWARRRGTALTRSVRVYPNFAEIEHYTLLAASDHLAGLGVRRQRRRGPGAEFHQLREYRRGDSLRQIDWKATSRMRKPIAREYQDERDQRLVFLLDCGRRMRHRDRAGRSHLDEALNALLLLAYVAVRQGDAVGLLAYGGAERWLPPRRAPDRVQQLLRDIFDIQPSLAVADHLAAAQTLLLRQPRRALAVFLTNSRDEDQTELLRAVRVLRRRHLCLVANLREAALDRVLAAPVTSEAEALRFHAVQAYLDERARQHERLQHLGGRVLDLRPDQLPAALVNAYGSIKRSALL